MTSSDHFSKSQQGLQCPTASSIDFKNKSQFLFESDQIDDISRVWKIKGHLAKVLGLSLGLLKENLPNIGHIGIIPEISA